MHVEKVYPDEAGRIIDFLAHRVQRPQEKINHGLVLGGPPGIGKDSLLEPVKHAVGPWNFKEVSPQQMLGRFNGFLKSVVLRISEAKDLGEVDRFKFYDHMKSYLAAPPDVLRVDEKNLREHNVFNVCGVVMTTNHKTNGIYLPADDRRHDVAWSDVTMGDFSEAYWNRAVALVRARRLRPRRGLPSEPRSRELRPKAPPPKDGSLLGDRRRQRRAGGRGAGGRHRQDRRRQPSRPVGAARFPDAGHGGRESRLRVRVRRVAEGAQEPAHGALPDGAMRLCPGAKSRRRRRVLCRQRKAAGGLRQS